jgi:hypothetical protein
MAQGNGCAAPENATEPHGPPPEIAIELSEHMAKVIALYGHHRKLKAELAEIAKANKANAENKLIAGALQLGAMIKYLQCDSEIRESKTLQPSLEIYDALLDRAAGGNPPSYPRHRDRAMW